MSVASEGIRNLSHYVRVPVLAAWDATPSARALHLDLRSGALAGQYTTPGQYVQMWVDDHPPSFFSIASAPEVEGRLEFLIRRRGPAAQALAALSPGDAVWVSPVAGAGFPVDRTRGGDLLLVAAGSGVAPIRAVVGHVLHGREGFGRVALLYGARSEDELAYADELGGWRAGGIDVSVVLSQPGGGWDGPRGHVQDVLAGRSADLGRLSVLACGPDGMIEAVSRALSAQGLPPEHIFRNF